MQRIRQPNRLTMNADRAKALLDAIRRRIERGNVEHADIKAKVFESFTKYFTELSQPTTDDDPLLGYGIRDPEQYSELMDSFQADVDSAAADARNLSDSIVSAFNYSSILAKQLDTNVRKVTSKSQDLQHLSNAFSDQIITAGDDFADDSKIDRSAALEVQMAEKAPNDSTITLKREGSVNMLNDSRVKIRVLSTFQIYEGLFHAPQGEARPEGNNFHFSGGSNSLETDLSAPGTPPELLRRFNSWRTDPSLPAMLQNPLGEIQRAAVTASDAVGWALQAGGQWGPFSHSEWDMLSRNFHFDPTFAFETGLINPKPRMAETDNGAPLQQKNDNRRKMIDGDPDTFWECEYVTDSSEALALQVPPLMQGIPPIEEPLGVIEQGVSLLFPGNPLGQQRSGSSVGADTFEEGLNPDTGPQVTLGQLIDRITSPAMDKMDLDVTLVFELPDPQLVNWINMLPHNFSDTNWLEVLDVSTSLDGTNWDEIEGLHDHKFENILTDEANTELTPEEVAVTMAPSRFEYTGQGVWTFPTREVKMIRIKLVQKTPVPAPYDVTVLELSTTITATHVSTQSWGLF